MILWFQQKPLSEIYKFFPLNVPIKIKLFFTCIKISKQRILAHKHRKAMNGKPIRVIHKINIDSQSIKTGTLLLSDSST